MMSSIRIKYPWMTLSQMADLILFSIMHTVNKKSTLKHINLDYDILGTK